MGAGPITNTTMHSSRIRTVRSFTVSGGGVPGRVDVCPGGWPCDLYHHAFDVTCMLPPHQLRPINSPAAYILLVGHVTCKACWDTAPNPPPPWTEFLTHACENITFPQLLLRAVTSVYLKVMSTHSVRKIKCTSDKNSEKNLGVNCE